jgi:hypothetical protein
MVVFADAGVMVLALLFSIVFATSYYTRAKKSIIMQRKSPQVTLSIVGPIRAVNGHSNTSAAYAYTLV